MMELNQRAMVIALARMCGLTGSNKEIYDKFWQTYQEVFKQEPKEPAKAEVFKRPI